MDSSDPRTISKTEKIVAVTERTGDRLAVSTVLNQRFALRKAARRHVRDETGMWIAFGRSGLILGERDDAVSDRLSPAVRGCKAHAPSAHKRLGDCCSFGHFRPGLDLQAGEPLGGLTD